MPAPEQPERNPAADLGGVAVSVGRLANREACRALLKVRLAILQQNDLRKAHSALGQRLFESAGETAELREISDLARKIEARRQKKSAPSGEKLSQKLVRLGGNAGSRVSALFLERELHQKFIALGGQREDSTPGPELRPEVDRIQSARKKIAELTSELESLSANHSDRDRLRRHSASLAASLKQTAASGWAVTLSALKKVHPTKIPLPVVAILALALLVGVAGLLRQHFESAPAAPTESSAPASSSLGVDLTYFKKQYPELAGPFPARPPGENREEYRAGSAEDTLCIINLYKGEVSGVQYILRREMNAEELVKFQRLFGKGQEWHEGDNPGKFYTDWVRNDGEVFLRQTKAGSDYTELQVLTKDYKEWLANR